MDRTEHSPALSATTRPDFDARVDRWVARFAPTTQRSYARWIAAWTGWCAANDVDRWTARRGDVETFLVALADRDLAPATRALAHDAVKSLYTWLYDDELIDRNPAARVTRPTVHPEDQRRTWLPPLRYAAFLEAAIEMGRDEHAVAVLGGMMGMRSAEMCSLDCDSLSVVAGHQVLRYTGKGGKPTLSPLPVPAQRIVLELAAERRTGALLRTRADTRLTTRSMIRLVARIGAAAGIDDLTPHGLRRTFATVGPAAGVNERDMMIAGRWARVDTLRRSYDMRLGELDNHASHRIAGFLSGIGG